MSRGALLSAYRGSLGRTQTTTVHVTSPSGDLIAAQVYTTVDAVSDPELVARMSTDDPSKALNVVRADRGDPIVVSVPVVYHDPAAELLVLVLGDSHRHRELDERIALLQRMRADEAAIPPYAKDFSVVYGPAGLRGLLEKRTADAVSVAMSRDAARDLERARAELDGRLGELEKMRETNDRRGRELERRALDLDGKAHTIERARDELEHARGEIERLRSEARRTMIAAAAAQASAVQAQQLAERATAPAFDASAMPEHQPDRTVISMSPCEATRPVALHELDEIETSLANIALQPSVPSAASQAERHEGADAEGGSEDAVQLPDPPSAPHDLRAHGDAGRDGEPGFTTDKASAVPGALEVDEEPMGGAAIVPVGADPLTTETRELPDAASDAWLDKAATDHASSITVDAQGVRLALVVGERLARGLGGKLDVRVLLHRTQDYPVITLVIGPPPALRVPSTTQLAIVPLDIALDAHRAVLAQLAKSFALSIELIVHRPPNEAGASNVGRGRRIRRCQLVAPLGENVGYIVRAAEDHLRGLSAMVDGQPSFERARDLVMGAGFDLLGVEHADGGEFRDDKLAQLDSAQSLRRAIAMARRFARPVREDYLVCTRGFPLPRWRELRRHVLESAVAWGLWMGPELAQVAVSEGLARSRRDLVVRLDHGFEKLKRHATAFDIDQEAADDNYKELSEEARALGVELQKPTANGRDPLTSEDASSIVGSIGGTPPKGMPKTTASVEELLVQLDDRTRRVAAAIELCERGDGRAAAPVIAAVSKMSRAEAVRVLGMSVKLGEAVAAPLTEGLKSSKGFLRHGCALALALLRTEDGTQAVIDLLINEPTEIWREVARAIGQVGPTALMPLASNFGRLGDLTTPQVAERVAWAMAHIAVRGGKAAVETMANGQSVMAPVARHALELHASAARDQVRIRPGIDGSQPGRDVTVNRAFSRRFFEALEQGRPEEAHAGLEALDASGPMEILDEADLIEDEEDGEQLDESDLIQT